MTSQHFYELLLKDFPYDITHSQEELLHLLSRYIFDSESAVFLLKGYAGTGKTTIISNLVKNLWKAKQNFTLLAPTGRAAKVVSSYSNTQAYTIHRHLYYSKTDSYGKFQFKLRNNKQRNRIYIIDEASMISDKNIGDSIFNNASLLSDLIQYVYSQPGNKLILVGDTAQLPPVGKNTSPALDKNYLKHTFDLDIVEYELDEVVRQSYDSGILFNATKIRIELGAKYIENVKLSTTGFDDFIRLENGYDIQDAIEQAYSNNNFDETAIIVRSNKRANLYNQQIRNRILLKDNELDAGDYLMVVKNNYFWLDNNSPASFIANGDIVEILEIYRFIDLYGFRFAEVRLRMLDYPEQKPFDVMIMLDTLYIDAPSLAYKQMHQLYLAVSEDYAHLITKWQRYKKVKENKYFNALQVKFAYALTAHKSQGGQWNNIFVEQPYMFDPHDKEQLRWLYTAFTRARKKLYLIGFKSELFIE